MPIINGRYWQRTVLYRYYDADDVLLYIGITDCLPDREDAHIKKSLWMELAASARFERFPERCDAELAERVAVETERPVFNRQYNDTPEARQRAADYLAAREDELPADLSSPILPAYRLEREFLVAPMQQRK